MICASLLLHLFACCWGCAHLCASCGVFFVYRTATDASPRVAAFLYLSAAVSSHAFLNELLLCVMFSFFPRFTRWGVKCARFCVGSPRASPTAPTTACEDFTRIVCVCVRRRRGLTRALSVTLRAFTCLHPRTAVPVRFPSCHL